MQYRYFLPIALFILTVAILFSGLWKNPAELPSAMVGKPVPEFDLPPVSGLEDKTPGLSAADLKGKPALVNFFASWCIPCKAEHPLLLRLKESGVAPVYGVNYKDKPEDALRWLNDLGNPYMRIGDDSNGRVGIDWGVYGVPETYVVDASGKILYRYAGPLTSRDLEETILPLLKGQKK
jgi:cytochrome c biogenesis protein CcmG/thiol:disulfide interchange protein DsbE